jgi:HK97 family phage prohead protease
MNGELEYRTATQIGVSWEQRTIDLIVMPYESEATVIHRGRVVREVVTRGAFDGIDRRPNRVRVNRDHDVTRTVGRATALHPSREEGLVAEIRIAQTPLGDETLALAADDILDASAGFCVMAGGETWEQGRELRRLTKLWLGHIAMTPDPAYEDARVLAVRTAPPETAQEPRERVPTPNLDQIRRWRLEARWAALDGS